MVFDNRSLDANRSKFSLSPPPTTQRDGLRMASNSSKKGWARRAPLHRSEAIDGDGPTRRDLLEAPVGADETAEL